MPRLSPYAKLAARAARANVVRPSFPFKLTFCIAITDLFDVFFNIC